MTNKIDVQWISGFLVGALIVLVLALFLRGAYPASGDNPGSLAARFASSSIMSMDGSVAKLYATSSAGVTGCSARALSTTNAIRVTLSDAYGQRPAKVVGYHVATNTTVVFPAENFGCGAIYGISEIASSTVTINETW